MSFFSLQECLVRLATRNPGRTEADIQADVRDVLLYGGFELGEDHVLLESPAPDRRRIDVEVGALVIECKKDLRSPTALTEAEGQLNGYLVDREAINGSSFVGVLTDGLSWRCYRTSGGGIELVSTNDIKMGQVDERRFRWWLGALLATERHVLPTAQSIEERLGSQSPGCQLALKELSDLLDDGSSSSEVRLKRELWAKLLRTALGNQFRDDDELFVEHTYLVLVSTLIAHIVIGFDAIDVGRSPGAALSGQFFARNQIRGVGEAGFFDWVLDVPGGERIVADLSRRLAVFAWAGVDHDVLKALYQSVIAPETRHKLGEYYTPDWLASRVVDTVVTNPLDVRVLDPACGSGTFLFHAIRRYLTASASEGRSTAHGVSEVVEHVFGMDLHPVAVVLAQVTYLLAIGSERLTEAGIPISIPVYLGDSMRWEIAEETFLASSGDVVVPTGTNQTLFGSDELRFPAAIVADPGRFDRLVEEIASRASSRERGSRPLPIRGLLNNFAISETDIPVLEATYQHLCDLHDQGRDHIWGFFVRNQARPTWFADLPNRVDVLIGNPPWLSYRFMSAELQEIFQRRAKERKLWVGGGRGRSTQQDLSAFFVARSIELYLRVGGRFAFVMPLAALSRQTYAGFRKGNFSSNVENNYVAFETPWDLDEVDPAPFPVPASVVLGSRAESGSYGVQVPLPATRIVVRGQVEPQGGAEASRTLSWEVATPTTGETAYTGANSPYARRFRQGAILVPRMLVFVEVEVPGPLQPSTHTSVRSRRGRLDKKPWKDLSDLSGVVETMFLRKAYLGEHCLPFRLLEPGRVVIPFDGTTLLSGSDDRIDRYPGVADWWRRAEEVWKENRSSEKRTLLEQLDYIHQLSAQFPTPQIRVVYTKAGNHLTAAIVTDPQSVIDHMLYWSATSSMEEAHYLAAILNAPALGEIVAPYQSRGAFGARHFDKYVWYPPIPEFDASDERHRILAQLGKKAEDVVDAVSLPGGLGFQRLRAVLRAELAEGGLLASIDDAVKDLLSR